MSIQQSLILLKTKALNAAFTLGILVDQKFISKNDVTPINSHPKNITNKLPPVTKHTILITKAFIKSIRRSRCGSYLKYEKVYANVNRAIDTVKNIKLYETQSMYSSKSTE